VTELVQLSEEADEDILSRFDAAYQPVLDGMYDTNFNAVNKMPDELKPDVRFWTRIYTEVTTSQGLIHDNKYLNIVFLFLCLAQAASSSVPGESDHMVQIDEGNEIYKAGDYESAIGVYELLLKNGNIIPELHYNLGNAYFKTAKIPLAILHYERAMKTGMNFDEDLRFNLHLANLKIVDKIEGKSPPLSDQWWIAMASYATLNGWAAMSIVGFWIFVICMYGYKLAEKIRLRKLYFYFGFVILGLSMLSLGCANTLHESANIHSDAIVMSASVTVKSEPNINGTELFVLHAGVKVRIVEVLGEWNRIEISSGDNGWLRNSTLEVI